MKHIQVVFNAFEDEPVLVADFYTKMYSPDESDHSICERFFKIFQNGLVYDSWSREFNTTGFVERQRLVTSGVRRSFKSQRSMASAFPLEHNGDKIVIDGHVYVCMSFGFRYSHHISSNMWEDRFCIDPKKFLY